MFGLKLINLIFKINISSIKLFKNNIMDLYKIKKKILTKKTIRIEQKYKLNYPKIYCRVMLL